jgi:mycothiol synthase
MAIDAATTARLRLRPYAGEGDLAYLVRIHNAAAEADGVHHRTNLDELAARVAHPSASFEPFRDITLAELDGDVVGLAMREVIDTTDGFRAYGLDCDIDPAYRRRGIGRALLDESMRAQRQLAGTESSSREPILGAWCSERQPGAEALLVGAGFDRVRWFFGMVRPNLDHMPDIPLPEGLELRTIDRAHARQVWDAHVEAFADHWGGFDSSEESFQRSLDSPTVDLSMWVVAFDGDEVAGGIVNDIDPEQNSLLGVQRGWLQTVFTRRRWRRRGLASALITTSLRVLRDRGMTSAALGVDADNPSGALGLYEGLGFAVDVRSTAWRKAFS